MSFKAYARDVDTVLFDSNTKDAVSVGVDELPDQRFR